MTDEMKLLRAFIKAQGYEIEETTKYLLDGEEVEGAMRMALPLLAFSDENNLEITTDYKVTKEQLTSSIGQKGEVSSQSIDFGESVI